jgi:hypothetical protein
MRSYIASCEARNGLRARTIDSFLSSGWTEPPVVVFDDAAWEIPLDRHRALVRRILEMVRKSSGDDDLVLLLEDDIVCNRHLRHNLENWRPIRTHRRGEHFFASLFNPGVKFSGEVADANYARAQPETVYGSQALILSRETAHFLATCWGMIPVEHADLKVMRLAGMICPILYHVPSLVQHVGRPSLWGGPFLTAEDFDPEWRAREEI